MLQTNSAGAVLPGPAMDKASGKGGNAADESGAFSQEFEKQVKKSSDSGRETEQKHARTESGQASDKSAKESDAQGEKSAPRADDSAAKHAEKGEAGKQKGKDGEAKEAESGKKLPQQVAAELTDAQEKKNADTAANEQAVSAMVEHKDKAVEALLKGRREQDDDDPLAMLPLNHAISTTTGADSADTEAAAGDDGIALTQLRLRDVLAQRMMGGGSQGDHAAGRQGKMDMNALVAMQINQGKAQQASFDEALKLGATAVSGLQQQAPAAQPAAANVPVAMTLAMPMQQQGWDKAMAERVVWMARGNIQQAQLQLNPRDLGPIDIKISMQHDQTHVNFVAHHAATRDAIEAALPRLRDMMNEQGLNLGQADVSQHSFGGGDRHAAAANGGNGQGTGGGAPGDEEMIEEGTVIQHVGHVSASGVDYFA